MNEILPSDSGLSHIIDSLTSKRENWLIKRAILENKMRNKVEQTSNDEKNKTVEWSVPQFSQDARETSPFSKTSHRKVVTPKGFRGFIDYSTLKSMYNNLKKSLFADNFNSKDIQLVGTPSNVRSEVPAVLNKKRAAGSSNRRYIAKKHRLNLYRQEELLRSIKNSTTTLETLLGKNDDTMANVGSIKKLPLTNDKNVLYPPEPSITYKIEEHQNSPERPANQADDCQTNVWLSDINEKREKQIWNVTTGIENGPSHSKTGLPHRKLEHLNTLSRTINLPKNSNNRWKRQNNQVSSSSCLLSDLNSIGTINHIEDKNSFQSGKIQNCYSNNNKLKKTFHNVQEPSNTEELKRNERGYQKDSVKSKKLPKSLRKMDNIVKKHNLDQLDI